MDTMFLSDCILTNAVANITVLSLFLYVILKVLLEIVFTGVVLVDFSLIL